MFTQPAQNQLFELSSLGEFAVPVFVTTNPNPTVDTCTSGSLEPDEVEAIIGSKKFKNKPKTYEASHVSGKSKKAIYQSLKKMARNAKMFVFVPYESGSIFNEVEGTFEVNLVAISKMRRNFKEKSADADSKKERAHA